MMNCLRGLILALAVFIPASVGASVSIETALEGYILSVRPWSDVEVRNLSLSAQPPKDAPKRIAVRRGLPGPTVFTLEYKNGAVVTAKADVEAYEEIVVASRQLLKNRPITEDDVFLARTEIGKIPIGAVRDPKEIVGKVVNRSIGQNLPILHRHIAGTKFVKRGRMVTIIAESNGMRVSAMGETRENAYIDDVVKVTNLESKKTVTGILIDENTVRVSF